MSKPKRLRPSRVARARFGYFAGVLLIAAGIGWQIGWGWGAVAAGIGAIAYTVLLYDVDEPQPYDPDSEVRYR
jgi:hypothetical protein